MRPTIRRAVALAACAVLAACSSGTVIVVRRPVPPPPPPPPRLEPLEITVARPMRGHLLVQTNRPSYVALFEIVPDRGVALLAPAYAHQRTWMLAGLNWVPVSWKVQSTMYYGQPAGTAVPARWVYAIASDEPLRLPDEAFHPAYMRRVLGPVAYRGTNPYVTMRAIARAFVPSVVDEMWAEDAYALAATYTSDPYRTVRIYCANRTVYEVPEEMADRAWCPVPARSGGTVVRSTPVRPDSVVASNGQRLRRRMPESVPVRAPIDRVSEPTPPDNAPITTDNTPPRNDTNKDVKDVRDVKDSPKDRPGNKYGHTDDPDVKGRGIENEKAKVENHKQKLEKEPPAHPPAYDPPRPPRVDPPANNDSAPQTDKVEVKQEKQEEKQIRHEEKQEDKQIRREEKQQEKAEEKVEQKAEKHVIPVDPPRQPETPVTAPDHKPETKAEQKHEDRSVKSEEKAESKPEVKTDKKEEKAESKPEEKAEEKSTGKPEDKPGKPDSDSPGKKDNKSKP